VNTKKRIILGFIIFILLAAVIFISVVLWSYMQKKDELNKSLNEFSKIIESGNLDDITLTIYYMDSRIDTHGFLSVDDLIKHNYTQKFVIEGNNLKDHIDMLKQISNVNLVPVMWKSFLNAQIYYVFETEKDGKILDVALWGWYTDDSLVSIPFGLFEKKIFEQNMFVNGIEVKYNDIFCDAIWTFLPDDVIKDSGSLEDYLNKEHQSITTEQN